MSNYGQAALSIVGFVVGSYFGYPQLGFVLGSLAGQALFPTQLPGVQGPRLQDTRTTTAQVGAPVMEVFGVDAVPGVVMYTGNVREVSTTEEVGGKGGPEQDVTSYTYFQTLAVGLCRGPMGGILQIFENGKLVYDRMPRRDDESDTQFANRIAATDAYESTMVVYLGGEDQMPDPTLEAEIGIGRVPGFRGLMYIVWPERELQQSQGLRHPNFKFIVHDEGALSCVDITDYSGPVVYSWEGTGPDPRNCLNDHLYTGRVGGIGGGSMYFDSLGAAVDDLESITGKSYVRNIQNIGYSSQRIGPASPHLVPYGAFPDSGAKYFLYNTLNTGTWLAGNPSPNGGIGNGYRLVCATVSAQGMGIGDIFWWSGRNQDYPNPLACSRNYAESGLYMLQSYCSGYANPGNPPTPDGWTEFAGNGCIEGTCLGTGGAVSFSPDARIQVTRVARAPDHPCLPRCGTLPPDYSVGSNYCVTGGRILSKSGTWEAMNTTMRVLRAYDPGVGGSNDCDPAVLPLNPARPIGHPEFNDQDFWEAAYADAVESGLMQAGLTYLVDYPQQISNDGYQLDYAACTVSTDGVSLARIVEALCHRVGLTDDLINVSDLEDRYVTGYVITRVMNARDAIEPLRLVGYFDLVESEGLLKFITRGKGAVRTIDSEELGAHESGSDAPPAIVTRKLQDVDLPRQIRLHYRDPGRDYEDGEQLSPTRLITDAVNDVDIECPVAISATLALQSAEVNWASAWAGRWVQQLNLGAEHSDLEPADCVVIPLDGRYERIRIVSIEGPILLRKVEAVRDDADGYVSTAIAPASERQPQQLVIYSTSELVLLDIPALRDEDDDAGIYAAAYPTDNTQSWSGVRIYHSTDGGATFVNEASITNAATVGTLVELLPASDWHTWDDTNVITVQLRSGSFESRDRADVLAGANALAIGRHGFWEIVQFETATLIDASTNTWELSSLLRGRRGTEYQMGNAGEGDDVVLISGLGIVRLPLEDSEIGQEQIYKAVSINTSYSTGIDQTLTPEGVALRPFSPVFIEGEYQTNGDLLISWVRRDRLGQTLQSSTPLPMSEDSLSFEVDIYDGSSNVIRTLSSTTTEVTYTLADQTADFGSPTAQPLTVAVYQISAVVDRGTPGIEQL